MSLTAILIIIILVNTATCVVNTLTLVNQLAQRRERRGEADAK